MAVLMSAFARRFAEVEARLPPVAKERIRRTARERVVARWRAGRADGPLLFDDLAEQIEDALMGKGQ